MKVVVRFSKREELKALPILLRHSPGMMLRDGSYVIEAEAARALQAAAVKFEVVSSEADPPSMEGAKASEGI
jgi:hypothetical protein